MDARGIDESVRSLIAQHLGSVERLDVLLWMFAHPHRDWTGAEVSDELRTNERSATSSLEDLARRGFLAPGGRGRSWRWAPSTPDLSEAVEKLAKTYAEKRYTVIELIFSKPADQLLQFAAAFRMRREEEDDDDA